MLIEITFRSNVPVLISYMFSTLTINEFKNKIRGNKATEGWQNYNSNFIVSDEWKTV